MFTQYYSQRPCGVSHSALDLSLNFHDSLQFASDHFTRKTPLASDNALLFTLFCY